MKITWFGTACFGLESGEDRILFDPFLELAGGAYGADPQELAQYDTIFVGFPIWWYVAPTIINSFLEAYDFSGKKIVLFATSGGSGFGKAVTGLQPSAPDAVIVEGALLNGRPNEAKLKAFAEKY